MLHLIDLEIPSNSTHFEIELLGVGGGIIHLSAFFFQSQSQETTSLYPS